MKTPMQELLEWVRATLPMDLDTPRMIEQKIESMLKKEKETICNVFSDARHGAVESRWTAEEYFEEIFDTKEK
jgi:hypothetical protein